jgi:hypothetical protein
MDAFFTEKEMSRKAGEPPKDFERLRISSMV